MKFETEGEETACLLMILPWQFDGMRNNGGKEGEEYWLLGGKFLQNYYTVFDFESKKIGLIESKTSEISKKSKSNYLS